MDPPRSDAYRRRCGALREELASLESVAVAVSGGVDSGVLLHAAHAALGPRAVGVVADSPSLPRRELESAAALARAIGARLRVVATDELADARYRANAGDRCYFCKRALFDAMQLVAAAEGLAALAFGEIVDDRYDDRPGARAARERGVRAPLCEAGFRKEDVRRYAAEHGLAVATKPASACLASRLPVGTPVTRGRLAVVERAEETVRGLGFEGLRVRHLGRRARLELAREDLERGRALRAELERRLGLLGFAELEIEAYVAPRDRVRSDRVRSERVRSERVPRDGPAPDPLSAGRWAGRPPAGRGRGS